MSIIYHKRHYIYLVIHCFLMKQGGGRRGGAAFRLGSMASSRPVAAAFLKMADTESGWMAEASLEAPSAASSCSSSRKEERDAEWSVAWR